MKMMDRPDHMMHTGTSVADPPASHGMAVVGLDTIFLDHLAMFHSPHNYQVILHVSFGPADALYREDRQRNPETRLYTFAPEKFVLPSLFPGAGGTPPALQSFSGSLVRNHFEQPPAHPAEPVEIASDVEVRVVEVVHQHRLDPRATAPEHLSYLLFGKGAELFLAHRITGRPAFDQLLAIGRLLGPEVTDDQLRHGVDVTVLSRPDTHGHRIQEGETVSAIARVAGQDVPVDIDADIELYVETKDFL
jgi:hypothetical protein